MSWLLTVCVVTASLAGMSLGYPTGAPLAACDTLLPQHNSSDVPITNDAFYITVEATSDTELRVTINTTDVQFKGFILAADDPTGAFTPVDDNAQVLDCPDQPTVTHTNRELKNSITVLWEREEGLSEVNFLATAVTDYYDDYVTGISYDFIP
nr:putative defense protein 3 [Procambarus clarkii]